MRRMLLATFIAATLGVPAAAFAKPTTGMNTSSLMQNGTQQFQGSFELRDRTRPQAVNSFGGALGAGMDAGSIDGHPTGPGNSPIDNSVRAPINDVQPGHGTSDTLQNRNPPPVRQLPAQ